MGSEDGYLRLWPLDFSSVLLEAGETADIYLSWLGEVSLPQGRVGFSGSGFGNAIPGLDSELRGQNTVLSLTPINTGVAAGWFLRGFGGSG